MNQKRVRPRAIHKPGVMNKTEEAYAKHLQTLQQAGEIHSYYFEKVKLVLAKRTSYTPDFMVIRHDGVVEFHEVKGYWEDDARVKIKVAAEMFPFVFVGVKKSKSGWEKETFQEEATVREF